MVSFHVKINCKVNNGIMAKPSCPHPIFALSQDQKQGYHLGWPKKLRTECVKPKI